MSRTYSIGVASVPLAIAVDDQGPVSGLTITAKVVRLSDEALFDFNDSTFKTSGIAQPTETLPESSAQAGLYVGTWDTSGISTDTEVSVLYESTATQVFIEEESIHLAPAPTVSAALTTMFLEAVIDKTQRTMTVVYGLSDDNGLVNSSSAVLTITDEVGTVLFSATTSSGSGLHRKVFPNVSVIPNRIMTVTADFTVGILTISRVQALKILGTA